MRALQFTYWPYNAWFIIFVVTTYFIPVTLWLSRAGRRNLLDNVHSLYLGEHRNVVGAVPDYRARSDKKQVFSFIWADYAPSPFEIIIVGATFALVATLMLLFSRVFPLVPLYDVKEGTFLKPRYR